MQDTVIEACNLSFSFNRRRILTDISFRSEAGKIYGLFGPNGSGKTTLFNILCGFHQPTSGLIRYYGKEPKRLDPWFISKIGQGLARSFQIPIVVDDLSVVDNLMLSYRFPKEGFSVLFRRVKKERLVEEAAKKEILVYLERFDLVHKCNLRAGALSYGERRLISILRAVLTGSNILLFDEPFSNLNILTTEKLKVLFRSLVDEEERMILLIEHRPDNIVNFVDGLFQLHRHTLEFHKPEESGEFCQLISKSIFRYE